MKRTALKRRVSLRDSFIRKLKREGRRVFWSKEGRNWTFKRKRPLKKISRAKKSAYKVYYVLQEEFLAKPENKFCLICTVRREWGENILIQVATEVHHWAGRIGRLLCYVPFFRPSCRGCRDWPHQHGETARKMGLLAPATIYNVFPAGGKNGT